MATTTTSYANLSGPDFLKFSRQQIKALSLDDLQLMVLRSQQLLSTALFKPVQCLFEVMPDEFVIEIFLEWLYIEDLAIFDRALTNHYYRPKYLHLLKETEHKGVLSVSKIVKEKRHYLYLYDFSSGLPEWLENRNIFMRELWFVNSSSNKGVIPEGFLASTGQQLLSLRLTDDDLEYPYEYAISDAVFAEIVERCPRLEELCIRECSVISDMALWSLAHFCPRIHTLSVNEEVTDSGLALIGEGCKALKIVNLEKMMDNLSDTGLGKLAELCPNLEEVYLYSCSEITDAGVSSLAKYCAGLHTLELNGLGLVTDFGLARLGECCKALTKIDLYQTNISDIGLRKLAEGCPRLEDVNVAGCEEITDGGLSSLAACRAMKTIGCFNMLGITDEGLRKLAEGCPSLEFVNLAYCTQVTGAGVSSLAQYCAGLHKLDLSFTQVTDIGLARLGEGCKALKEIDLSQLNISDTGLRKLAEGCPRLYRVDLRYCRNISDDGVISLVQSCPGLGHLSLGGTQFTTECKARLNAAYPAVRFYG